MLDANVFIASRPHLILVADSCPSVEIKGSYMIPPHHSSTEDGVTPVHIAAIWGRVENIKLLLGCGGDPERRDWDNLSAFDYAAREQQWQVYDYLHNVVDQHEDTFGTQCAYTLHLGE